MLRTMSHDVHRKLEEEGCGSAAMRARGLSGRSGLCNDEVFYDEPDRDVAIDTLRRAREIGIDFLDSSNAYGRGRNGNWKAIAMST